MGSNDQCDGNQCCPSFGGSLRRHHQEWSLRLNLTQQGKTHHQVLTRKSCRIDSSFLIPRVALRGRSQLVKSFVWLVPPVRIVRLIAPSLSWCMAVLRSWNHLSGYSRFCVHFEKEERRREEEKKRKEKSERERESKRTREEEKK